MSDPAEEVITTIGKVDLRYKSWPRVDTSETFFQVHVKQRSEDDSYGACLLSTPRALLDYLAACTSDNAITVQQIIITTAPHTNRSKTWKTETLIKIEVGLDKHELPNKILYHTADDCYSECRIYGKGQSLLETVYQARKTRRG